MARLSRRYGRLLDAVAVVACLLLLDHDLDDRRRCVSAQHRRAAAFRRATSSPRTCLYLITLLTAPWPASPGPAHPHRHPAARAARPRGWLLEWIGDVIGIVCCLYFVWYGTRVTVASYLSGSISIKTLIMPEWWLLAPMPVAFALLAIEFVFRMYRLCAGRAASAGRRRFGGLNEYALMSWQMASLLLLGGSTVLLFIGMPVAFSFIAINLVGAMLFLGGDAGLHQMVRNSVPRSINFSLTPIPLFILMGEVLFHTGLALKVIDGVERLIRQVPGRLAVVAVVAGTVFSAISGSTIATTAMLGSLMLPVMLSRGYHPTMATGPIMAIGAVDMLIPPSALTVLLGSLSGISISKLLIGGVVPGLMLSVAFVAYIVVRVKMPIRRWRRRRRSRSGTAGRNTSFSSCYVMPLVSIFVVVVGAMSGGHRHADRVGRARRDRHDGAGAALSCAHARRTCCSALRGTVAHLRHDPVHHSRAPPRSRRS